VHEASIYVAIFALLLCCVLALADRSRRSRRTAVMVGLSLGAVALVVLTAVAWNRIQWVQLGLWAVTVGTNSRGLWYAAFSDEVRFVFVDGMSEMSPSDVAPWVVIHLVAPFIALVTFTPGWLIELPARGPRRSVVAPDLAAPA
jgi:hypothetical protein